MHYKRMLAVMMITSSFVMTACDKHQTPLPGKPIKQQRQIQPKNNPGIDAVGVRLSAADYFLDFRYRVTDPVKAAQLINTQIKPVLIDEASGARVIVPTPPKVGALRHTGKNLQLDRTYFMLFANPGKFIKRGNKVTIALGDTRLENLRVE